MFYFAYGKIKTPPLTEVNDEECCGGIAGFSGPPRTAIGSIRML
jgi:hypothetical protein